MARQRIDWAGIGRTVGGSLLTTVIGMIGGALCVLVIFHKIGVLDVETKPLILRPLVVDAPGSRPFAPTPTPTVVPEPTPTEEEKDASAWRWDWRRKVDPNSGGDSDENTIDVHHRSVPPACERVSTGSERPLVFSPAADTQPSHASRKKKEKREKRDGRGPDGRITDTNGDGVVEFSVPLLDRSYVLGREVRPLFVTSWSHGCCTCYLIHHVDAFVEISPLTGQLVLRQRWTVDDDESHRLRTRHFGPGYWQPRIDDFRLDFENR